MLPLRLKLGVEIATVAFGQTLISHVSTRVNTSVMTRKAENCLTTHIYIICILNTYKQMTNTDGLRWINMRGRANI